MMKRLLKNKTGVTILEGLIALGLLALVAGGTFGVLLSVSRKASQPDIREEMLLAIERANEQLQAYAGGLGKADASFQYGLCGAASSNKVTDSAPLNSGKHEIPCLLPAICDRANSSFIYTVGTRSVSAPSYPSNTNYRAATFQDAKQITFDITCNGFTL